MSTAQTTPPPSDHCADPKSAAFDPEEFRMTIGEHLEELRRRLILGLGGFAVVAAGCLIFGKEVTSTFCQPLVDALQEADINPQVYFNQVGDAFMVFIQISLISAAAIAGPWMIYQVWQFIAAGLYPTERKYITRYVPLSIGLLIGGMVFVYFLVLPWTLQFFLMFGATIPLKLESHKVPATTGPTAQNVFTVPPVEGDPEKPYDLQMWYDKTQKRLKIFTQGEIRVIPFGPSNLLAPMITLPDYIDLVMGMLITFGLAFKLPLVVLALIRIGIVEIQVMRSGRKYVYFGMAILAAMITPGDVITASIALMVPLCLLYELGIFLAHWGNTKKADQPA